MPRLPRLRRHPLAAACAVLMLAPWAAQGPAAAAETTWADWTSGGPSGAGGTLALPSGGAVNVTFSGATTAVLTGRFPEPYWGPSGTYTGSRVTSAPPSSDGIFIAGGAGTGTFTITFAEAVINPVLAVASLGLTTADRSVNLQTSMRFDQPFEVLSNGPNYYAGGQYTPFITEPGTPNILYGTESSGTILFRGSFTRLSWTSPTAELNDAGVLVGTYLFTLGAVSCGEYRLEPLTADTEVPLGCTAYTRGAPFDQPFGLAVRGTLRAESFYTLAGGQDVDAGGRSVWQQGGLVAPAAALEVRGRFENNAAVEVAGRLRTHAGSTWGSAGLAVQPMADVVVGGVATLYGATSVNGTLRIVDGGQATTVSPLLVGGPGSRVEVQAGGRLQAVSGLQAGSGANVVVGGELVVQTQMQLSGATLEVRPGGLLQSTADGEWLATVSNGGRLSLPGGVLRHVAGNLVNGGQLELGGGQLLLQAGVVAQNLPAGRIELSGMGGLGLGGAALTNQGLVDAKGGSSLDFRSASVINTGTLRTGEQANLTVIGGSLDNGGTLHIGGGFFSNGSLTNTGELVVRPERLDQDVTNAGVLANQGTMRVDSALPGTRFVNTGVLRNQGQLQVVAGAVLDNQGSLFNNGRLAVDGFLEINGGTFVQSPTGSLVVNGRLSTPGGLLLDGGSLGGSGVIDGPLILTAGASALPGNSPGTLTVNGRVEFNGGARLVLEVGRSGAHDQLRADGLLVRDGGVVQISFVDGLAPDLDQTFDLLRVASGGTLQLDVGALQGLPEALRSDSYDRDDAEGRTVGLAFRSVDAWRLEAPELSGEGGLWIGAGQQRYADTPLGTLVGPLQVDGTLGLRRDSRLTLNEGWVSAGGRLLTSAGSFEHTGRLTVAGEFVQRGRAVGGAVLVESGGRWTNTGSFTLGHPTPTDRAAFANAGEVRHAGGTWRNETVAGELPLIDNLDGGRFEVSAGMTGAVRVRNAGQWVVAAGARMQDVIAFEQSAGRLHVDGELQAATLRVTGGQVSGRGRIDGPAVLRVSGDFADPGAIVLRPGAVDGIGGGTLAFGDRLELGMGTLLEFVIGADGRLARLQLPAGASFGASVQLNIVLAEGFMPSADWAATIFELGPEATLDGFFENVAWRAAVFSRGTDGDTFLPDVWAGFEPLDGGVGLTLVNTTPVPEPATLTLMLAGLGVAAGWRRRRVARA